MYLSGQVRTLFVLFVQAPDLEPAGTVRCMNKSQSIAVPFVALLLEACSGASGEPSLEEGWDLMVSAEEARQQGFEFDFDAWETVILPGVEDPSGDVTHQAVAEICATFDTEADDYVYKRIAVNTLLRSTLWAQAGLASNDYPDGYREASAQVEVLVERDGPSTAGVDAASEEHASILDEQYALRDQYWESEYPEFSEYRAELTKERVAAYEAIFSEEMVQAAQEMYVDKCEIELPDGYEHPSADELGVTLVKETLYE